MNFDCNENLIGCFRDIDGLQECKFGRIDSILLADSQCLLFPSAKRKSATTKYCQRTKGVDARV